MCPWLIRVNGTGGPPPVPFGMLGIVMWHPAPPTPPPFDLTVDTSAFPVD
ncbi:hypothetical protein GCM10010272_38660 [Streptomyces lateritius]|nr:hypothetical protein GCM10010272_38660 [Streptomyces lateritius]